MDVLKGFCRVTDNVLRRREWEARVPGLVIRHVDDPWLWAAEWPGHAAVIRDDLGSLLDDLDIIFGR